MLAIMANDVINVNIQTDFFGFLPFIRTIPMTFVDHFAETAARVPVVRNFGVHVIMGGQKPG